VIGCRSRAPEGRTLILLAVTRGPLAGVSSDAASHALTVGDWTIHALAEGTGVRCETRDGGLRVEERCGAPPGVLLASLSFDPRTRRLDVRRPAPSGRPLYWVHRPDGSFACATRASALRRAGVELAADGGVLPEVLVYRIVLPPRTLYRDVRALPAGASLEVEIGERGCQAPVVRPWVPPSGGSAPADPVAAVEERLRAAVDLLAPAADDLVVLLSGGLDSSVLYRLCRERFATRDTWSISNTFGGEDDLEKPYAFSAAEALGADHHWRGVDEAGYRSAFLRALARAEEPLHHVQSVLIHEVVVGARPEGGGVVVCGEGADSVFGQELQRLIHRADRLRYRILAHRPLRDLLRAAVRVTGRDPTFADFLGARRRGDLPLEDPRHLLWTVGAYGSAAWVREHLGAGEESLVAARRAALAHVRDRPLLDLVTLLGVLGDAASTQAIWDKLAEAAGSRMVYPFSDPDLLDLAFRLPWALKLREPKHLLREAARGLGVPAFVVERPKAGFGVHERHWARPGGAFDPFIPLAAKHVDEAWLRGLLDGDSAHAMTFWSLLNHAIWRRLAIDGEPFEDLEAELRESEARASRAP